MDPLQITNRNAASQYLFLLDQARTPDMVVKVIQNALADPGVVAFAELYSKDSVQQLKKSDLSIWLDVLEVFMWGTYEDYEGLKTKKPDLNDAQKKKLRLLTLVTLASKLPVGNEKPMFIPNLRNKLYLAPSEPDTAVAQIFIAAQQQKLLDGTIDAANQTIEIKAIFPARDLNPNEMGEMNHVLGLWVSRAEAELKRLNTNMDDIKTEAQTRRELEAQAEEKLEAAISESNKTSRKRGGASGNEGIDPGAGSSRNIRRG